MGYVKLFKSARILALGIFLIGFALILVLDSRPVFGHYTYVNVFTVAVVIIVWVVLIFTLPVFMAKRKYNKIQDIFNEECDPLKYIEAMENLLRENAKVLNESMSRNLCMMLELTICSAYLETADYDTAKKILDGIEPFQDTTVGFLIKLDYFCCLYNYYAYTDDLTKAEEALNNVDNLIMLYNKSSMRPLYRSYLNSLNLRKGKYDGLEQYYINKFDHSSDRLGKVFIQFKLGKIYFHDNRIEEARKAFEYVVQSGNTLHKVQEAKEFLEQLASGVSAV